MRRKTRRIPASWVRLRPRRAWQGWYWYEVEQRVRRQGIRKSDLESVEKVCAVVDVVFTSVPSAH